MIVAEGRHVSICNFASHASCIGLTGQRLAKDIPLDFVPEIRADDLDHLRHPSHRHFDHAMADTDPLLARDEWGQRSHCVPRLP